MLDVSIRPFAVRGTMERVGVMVSALSQESPSRLNMASLLELFRCVIKSAIDSDEESHKLAPMVQCAAAL